MTVWVEKSPRDWTVTLRIRAYGPDGKVGDTFLEVYPGISAFSKTYNEWMAIKEDSVDIQVA